MTEVQWEPVGDLENDMLAARFRGDQDAVVTRLVRADLLCPVNPAEVGSGAPLSWIASEISDHQCILAFTSTRSLDLLLGHGTPHRLTRVVELARTWPDQDYWLAVDPGLPIEVYLPFGMVARMADAACLPHTDLEKSLADALAAEDLEGYARGLLGADIVLPLETGRTGPRDVADPRFPWFRVTVPGDEYEGAILGYTSEDRMREQLGVRPSVTVPFAELVKVWPDAADAFAVNVGTEFAARLGGQVLRYVGDRVARVEGIAQKVTDDANARTELGMEERTALASWRLREELDAAGLPAPQALGALPAPEADEAGTGVAVQVVVAQAQVERFLTSGHSRVAGLIHRRPDIKMLPLGELYQRLDLLGPGSPFGAEDKVGYLVRWRESDPDAYREPRMDGLDVPDGAALQRLVASGAEEPLARYRAATGRWHLVAPDQ